MFSLASFNHGTQTRWQPTCFCSGSTSNPIFFLCLALCMSWKNPFARPIHLWENPFAGHILLVEEPFCRALVAKPFCKAYLACMVNSFSLSASTLCFVALGFLHAGSKSSTNCSFVFVVLLAWLKVTAAMSFLLLPGPGTCCRYLWFFPPPFCRASSCFCGNLCSRLFGGFLCRRLFSLGCSQ